MAKQEFLRLPVVSAGAEYLVMGSLMRRNILAYKAPPNNEGYDLICIHPDPRHQPQDGEVAQVRVQVKSRYATDCHRGFPVKRPAWTLLAPRSPSHSQSPLASMTWKAPTEGKQRGRI